QAEDGIRYWSVTGVQTCALPICHLGRHGVAVGRHARDGRPADGTSHQVLRFPRVQWSRGIILVHMWTKMMSGPRKKAPKTIAVRSEERRVGKECRYRWSTYK